MKYRIVNESQWSRDQQKNKEKDNPLLFKANSHVQQKEVQTKQKENNRKVATSKRKYSPNKRKIIERSQQIRKNQTSNKVPQPQVITLICLTKLGLEIT
jgi:hypothetical protein